LVIRRYSNPVQTGAIRSNGLNGGRRWIVRNNEVADNRGAGIFAGHGWRVLNNHVHHNGQIGVKAEGSDILIEGNQISHNNTDNHNPYWEAGGTKFVWTTNLVVRGNNVHNNRGPGIWTDIDNVHSRIENNTVRDNFGPGIFHEISYDAVIRNNLVERNGHGYPAWVDGAGILLNSSQNTEIYGNTLRNNNDGIGLIEAYRGNGALGQYRLRNVLVRNNTIVLGSGGEHGVVSVDNRGAGQMQDWNIRFEGNTYTDNTGGSRPFRWNGSSQSWDDWRAAGHDVNGAMQ